jgi:Transmembrane protein 231
LTSNVDVDADGVPDYLQFQATVPLTNDEQVKHVRLAFGIQYQLSVDSFNLVANPSHYTRLDIRRGLLSTLRSIFVYRRRYKAQPANLNDRQYGLHLHRTCVELFKFANY